MEGYTLLLRDVHGNPVAWAKQTSGDSVTHYIEFAIYTQESWSVSDPMDVDPSDLESYATVICKWDACCHWTYADAYQHLCGPSYWVRHAAIALAVHNLAQRSMVVTSVDSEWANTLEIPASWGFEVLP